MSKGSGQKYIKVSLTCVCIYTHIQTCVYVSKCRYVYIYREIYTYIYIYIYIYERGSSRVYFTPYFLPIYLMRI